MPTSPLPKLRPIDVRLTDLDGHATLVLCDPLALHDKTVIIPQELGPALFLCDGTRDEAGICASLMTQFGLQAEPELIGALVSALDETCLLENPRYEEAKRQAVEAYRVAPFRPPTLAGQSYPADPADLRTLLESYLPATHGMDAECPAQVFDCRGLISPHIDYGRGGAVYGAIWSRVADAARAADLVLLLGTDHYGDEGAWTLTRQHYATPFGVLPTNQQVVERLIQTLGEEAAFAAELHHVHEHAIELAATWLHFVRDGQPCDIVPVLCGSFAHFVRGDADPATDPTIAALVTALQPLMADRKTLIVAAADLAHVGPAFGGQPLDSHGRALLKVADDTLLGHIHTGDTEGFFAAIQAEENRNNVCGVPPIYLMLRLLAPTAGETVAYDSCPADDQNASAVTICGTLLS